MTRIMPKKTRHMLEIEQKHGQLLEDILRDAYAKHLNVGDAAIEIGIAYDTMRDWLTKFRIPRRRFLWTRDGIYDPELDQKLKEIERNRRVQTEKCGKYIFLVYPSQMDWLRRECGRLTEQQGQRVSVSSYIRTLIDHAKEATQ